MNLDSTSLATVVMTVAGTLVILYGVLLLSRLRNSGDLGRLLARAVVDLRTRNAILWGISLVSAMFVSMGFLRIAEDLGYLPGEYHDLFSSAVFLVGSASLLYLTWLGLRMTSLSLENELDLRDGHPELIAAIAEAPTALGANPASMYAAFPVEDAPVDPPGNGAGTFGALP